ncbi:hypothetical protein G6F49_002300 [Rhizopus delemar]|nr:hypothetical protein G6F49_002300 [Rhizopus delemar]KAG1644081.1 hypothetical protein G6F44_003191 [Rhizopus delemar]
MSINSQFKSFKMPKTKGHNNFFHVFTAEKWDFYNYFVSTHENINKFKSYKLIRDDYINGIQWISSSEAPIEVKNYVTELKDNLPSKAAVKAKKAKQNIKSPVNNHGIIMYNSTAGDIFFGDNAKTNEDSSSRNCDNKKRSLDNNDDISTGHLNKKKKPNNKISGLWEDWVNFMLDEGNVESFHAYSPENHGVIRCGRGVSPKPNLDDEIYNRHIELHVDNEYVIPDITKDYLNGVIDSSNLEEFRKKVKEIPDTDNQDNEITFNFLEDVFRACYNFYSSKQNLEKDEVTFNDMLVYPFLKAAANAVTNIKSCCTEFRVGETPLQSMAKQLNDNDDSTIYYADGIITLYGMEELEVLLLETSSFFGSKKNDKKCFDHHKGLFGSLSMIKTVADEYYLGSIENFSKVKIIFIQAAGRTIYIWSLKYIVEGPAYELWLEGRLDINPRFGSKVAELPKIISFYWLLKCLLEDSVKSISALKNEHMKKLKELRFASFPSKSLSTIINPSILRLVEEEDKLYEYNSSVV